jgi:hypothetical protein
MIILPRMIRFFGNRPNAIRPILCHSASALAICACGLFLHDSAAWAQADTSIMDDSFGDMDDFLEADVPADAPSLQDLLEETAETSTINGDIDGDMGIDDMDALMEGDLDDTSPSATPENKNAAEEEPRKTGGLYTLFHNASGTLKVVSTHYLETPNTRGGSNYVEDDDVELWSHLQLRTSAGLTDAVSVDISLDGVYSSYDKTQRGVFRGMRSKDERESFLDINEAYLTYTGETIDAFVGKKKIGFGVAEYFNPTDLYARTDNATPLLGITQGTWQASLTYYLEQDNISFFVMPDTGVTASMPDQSRWIGGSGDSTFSSVDLAGGYSTNSSTEYISAIGTAHPRDWGYLISYKGIESSLDYFVNAYHGQAPYPVLRAPDNLVVNLQGELGSVVKYKPIANILSGGISKVYDGWKFYSEGYIQLTENDQDDNYAKFVFGFKYRETNFANSIGLDEITPIAEWSDEHILNRVETSANGILASSESARPFRKNMMLGLQIKPNSHWDLGAAMNRSFLNSDLATTWFATYRPNDNLSLKAQVNTFDGKEDDHFGRWAHNDTLQLGLEYKF